MKEEYIGMKCSICGAPADGLHYGALSCRSCNAFFRRAVTFTQVDYQCRFNGNCDVTVQGRCGCRACRFRKCLQAGMKMTSVQPRRDPTGSQRERRKKRGESSGSESPMNTPRRSLSQNPDQSQDNSEHHGQDNTRRIQMQNPGQVQHVHLQNQHSLQSPPQLQNQSIHNTSSMCGVELFNETLYPNMNLPMNGHHLNGHQNDGQMPVIKAEEADYPSSSDGGYGLPNGNTSESPPSNNYNTILYQSWQKQFQEKTDEHGYFAHECLTESTHLNDNFSNDTEVFERLVYSYGEHMRMMQLSMTTFQSFLEVQETPEQSKDPTYDRTCHVPKERKLVKMQPTDVEKLSNTELTGLLYWIEKQHPYKLLNSSDRTALLKRYSVRKLSLDHFYHASKFKHEIPIGNFVMLNNSFVPPGETGFELPGDDYKQRKAKKEIFAPTFERIWRCVIFPFHNMKITHAEMVFLHGMLLWSTQNNSHVDEGTKAIMKSRREWYTTRLFEFFKDVGMDDDLACVRMGEIILLLSEIEVICDQHCQDFQVAKLFEFCDMSKYWYESLCYSSVNTMQISAHFCENLRNLKFLEDLGLQSKSPTNADIESFQSGKPLNINQQVPSTTASFDEPPKPLNESFTGVENNIPYPSPQQQTV